MKAQHRIYPWRKHYAGDRLADQRLLMVSLAARGLLADLSDMAYVSPQPGHLVMGEKAITADTVARLRGVDLGEVEAALKQLIEVGLVELDKGGVLIVPGLIEAVRRREQTKARVERHRMKRRCNNQVTHHVAGRIRCQNQSQTPDGGVGVKKRREAWQIQNDIEAVKGLLKSLNERCPNGTSQEAERARQSWRESTDGQEAARLRERKKQLESELSAAI
jgi:hypothetical protein